MDAPQIPQVRVPGESETPQHTPAPAPTADANVTTAQNSTEVVMGGTYTGRDKST